MAPPTARPVREIATRSYTSYSRGYSALIVGDSRCPGRFRRVTVLAYRRSCPTLRHGLCMGLPEQRGGGEPRAPDHRALASSHAGGAVRVDPHTHRLCGVPVRLLPFVRGRRDRYGAGYAIAHTHGGSEPSGAFGLAASH